KNSLPLSPQPGRNFVVIHDIVCNQGISFVDKHDPPLPLHPDFVGAPCQFAESHTPVFMRIAKSG
ncbi:MAG: hypothetical protein ABSC18_18425, partial [Verrucomicrobiota bacterium]